MLFNFQLRPIRDIAPWGQEGEYSLSWFGLTDGWYWLQCSGEELFRYSDSVLAAWKYEGRKPTDPPYVDYQVARLWEDTLEMLPETITPVPQQILNRIEPGIHAWRWYHRISDLAFTDDDKDSKHIDERFDLATTWLQHRKLDSLYLKEGPNVWFWCDGTSVFIRWHNAELSVDGRDLWTAQTGTYSLPLGDFVEEVRSFDRRLIAAMHDRVQIVQHAWKRPQINIDKETLLLEQEQRAEWLDKTLERFKNTAPPEWADVADAITYFERAGFPIRQAH